MSSSQTAFGFEKDEYQKLFDILNKYASGVQPLDVASEFHSMSDEVKQAIAPLALFAAVGARRTIEQDSFIQQYIQKVSALRAILSEKFMIQNKLNYTKLYVLGNLLLQSGCFDDVAAIRNYQSKIQGKSLLTSDTTKANLSEKKKEIIKNQISKYNMGEFLTAATTVALALTKDTVNSLLIKQQSAASTAATQSSSSSSSQKAAASANVPRSPSVNFNKSTVTTITPTQ